MGARLPTWKGRLMNKAGSLSLINSCPFINTNLLPDIFQIAKMGDLEDRQDLEGMQKPMGEAA